MIKIAIFAKNLILSVMDIKICMGTMCYVMGGAELSAVVDSLPEELARSISVSYSPCLGVCDRSAAGEPPYVEINGKIIGGVSRATLIQIIKEETLHNVV